MAKILLDSGDVIEVDDAQITVDEHGYAKDFRVHDPDRQRMYDHTQFAPLLPEAPPGWLRRVFTTRPPPTRQQRLWVYREFGA